VADGGGDPVKSAIIDLMRCFEFAALAEGTGPAAVQRICNRMLYGHPDGSAAWEQAGPQRYRLRAYAEAEAVLRELEENGAGLTDFDKAAVSRTRRLLAGRSDDPAGPASR
jgi:hypothetical protein